MRRNLVSKLSSGSLGIQLAVLSFLGLVLFLPHVQAAIVTPSTLPTSTDVLGSSLPTIPPTPNLNDAANEQLSRLTGSVPPKLPRTLEAASGDNADDIVSDSNQFTTNAITGLLGDGEQNSVDPAAAARGDIGAFFVPGRANDPLATGELASGIQRIAQDIASQRAAAVLQVQENIGITNPADCSTSNDEEGVVDLCSKMEELKRAIDEANDEVSAALQLARQIRTYVSNKPAFLSTNSIRLPVCLALVTDGPGISYDKPEIASNPSAYDPSAVLVSMEAIRAQLLDTAAATSSTTNVSTDPLAATMQSSQAGAATHSSGVATRQRVSDDLYARAVTNFKQDQQRRYDVLKSHSEELDTITRAILQVATALNLRLPTT